MNVWYDNLGSEKEKNELKSEFEKAFIDFLMYSESCKRNPFKAESIKV